MVGDPVHWDDIFISDLSMINDLENPTSYAASGIITCEKNGKMIG